MKQRAALIFFLVMLMAVSLPNFTPPVQANGAYGAIDYISATEIERVEGKSGAFATPNADLFQTSQLGDNAIPQGWPLQGKITSPFGKRTSPFVTPSTAEANLETEFHTGVDIGVVEGTPVLATADGIVEYAGNERGGYGEVVFITHSGGYTTVYGHNSRLLLVSGQVVNKGDVIALSGNSGHSTGPHLHYEVRYQGQPIDPEPFMLDAGVLTDAKKQ